jgi:hypothetical protein
MSFDNLGNNPCYDKSGDEYCNVCHDSSFSSQNAQTQGKPLLFAQDFDPSLIVDDSLGENDPGTIDARDWEVLPRDEDVLVLLDEIVDFGLCCGCLHVWLLARGVVLLYTDMSRVARRST